MVNFYNASEGAINLMRNGQFDQVSLKIVTESKEGRWGLQRWFFISNNELYQQGMWSRFQDACVSWFSTRIQWKEGLEIRPFYEQGIAFHEKLDRALHKAASLGRNIGAMQKKGNTVCMLHEDYWCELYTEKHLAKTAFYELQEGYLGRAKANEHLRFDQWVETDEAQICFKKGYPDEVIDQMSVQYLDQEQRKNHLVEIRHIGDEQFLYCQGKPLNTENYESEGIKGRAIFVIGHDDSFYIGSHIIAKFHHSSFFAGQPVICAGEIITNNQGKILRITDKSGHYKPCKQSMVDGLRVLREKGIDLSRIILVLSPKTIIKEGKEWFSGRYNAAEFLESRAQSPRKALEVEDYM